jgi:YidC/Oxa1 family membrane protein insertase
MEKRTILAIALSFLVLMGFDFAYRNYFAPKEPPPIVDDTAGKPSVAPRELPKADEVKESETVFIPSDTDTKTDGPREISVKGELYQAVLDNKGAVISSWILNNYMSSTGQNFEMVAAGEQGEQWSYPGSLFFDDPGISKLANEEMYEVSVNGFPYSGAPLSVPVDVVMILKRGDLVIQKKYSFKKENYTFDLSATFQQQGRDLKGKLFLGQDLGPLSEHISGSRAGLEATYFLNEKVKKESPPKPDKGIETISGDIRWVGLDMHYFTEIAIPEKPIQSFDMKGYEIKAIDTKGDSLDRRLLSITIPVDGSLKYLMYMGPKKQANLKAVPSYDLSGVIDYGMFSIIAHPLLYALRWIHQYVNNYGFAIILLTLLLSLLLFPLRLKQMLSMKKMQAVQPKVKAIQEKYKKYKKTDPKRGEMNQEIMALYKEHNVNPLGGCLPLLVQMPLLFAFYSLLANCIELRHAPFIGWIQDLSAKDPYYVLPIVMGITMFLSQKMTPMAPTADNSQAKMMQYLPVVFTFMFLTVSSGLNLYFLCSNIFQVGFQKIAEQWIGDGRNDGKSKRKKNE